MSDIDSIRKRRAKELAADMIETKRVKLMDSAERTKDRIAEEAWNGFTPATCDGKLRVTPGDMPSIFKGDW